jgi:hypothetical protein
MDHEDLHIIEAMDRNGGNFIRHLSGAYIAADPGNRRLIRETWAEEWEKYRAMAANFRHPQTEVSVWAPRSESPSPDEASAKFLQLHGIPYVHTPFEKTYDRF